MIIRKKVLRLILSLKSVNHRYLLTLSLTFSSLSSCFFLLAACCYTESTRNRPHHDLRSTWNDYESTVNIGIESDCIRSLVVRCVGSIVGPCHIWSNPGRGLSLLSHEVETVVKDSLLCSLTALSVKRSTIRSPLSGEY